MRLDVISFRDPWFPYKYNFVQKIASEWNLRIFDWYPREQGFQRREFGGKDVMAFMNVYRLGANGIMYMPKNLQELPDDVKWLPSNHLCAAHDFFQRPSGDIIYPWDLLLIGQKSADEEGVLGCDVVKGDINKIPDVFFPLRDWTDEDIWGYIKSFAVPFQTDRYGADGAEFPDKTNNPDWIPACVRCVDRRRTEAFVPCPKLGGLMVSSIASKAPYYEIGENNKGLHYYGQNV
jgi:hypothetical protein